MKKLIKYLCVIGLGIMLLQGRAMASEFPTTAGKTKWNVKIENRIFTTPPTLVNEMVCVASGSKVYLLDEKTGKTVSISGPLDGTVGYATIPVTYVKEKNLLVVAMIDGTKSHIYGLDADTLKKRWEKEVLGQVQTKFTYAKEKLCVGTLVSGKTGVEDGSGSYYEINASTGEMGSIVNRGENEGGFYWANAAVVGDYFIFGSDDGNQGSGSLYAYQIGTKQTAAEKKLQNGSGDVRSGIAVENDTLYFTSKGGYFHGVTFDERNGSFGEDNLTSINGQSTSTPILENGYAYVGVSDQTLTQIHLTDRAMKKITVPGYVQGDMQLQNDNLYMTYNQSPGGLYVVDIADISNLKGHLLYEPDTGKRQYCISPVVANATGTLFYKNDSGYIFAVESGFEIVSMQVKATNYQTNMLTWEKSVGATGYQVYESTSYGGTYTKVATVSGYRYYRSGLRSNQTYYYKVRPYGFINGKEVVGEFSSIHSAKPSMNKPSISLRAGKKKIKVKWTSVSGASGYQIYRKTSSKGKWKRIKTITKSKTRSYTNKKLKRKKKYYYKVRAYRKQSGGTAYSSYSSTKSKKSK